MKFYKNLEDFFLSLVLSCSIFEIFDVEEFISLKLSLGVILFYARSVHAWIIIPEAIFLPLTVWVYLHSLMLQQASRKAIYC